MVAISSRIAGPGELFSSDFQACAQSPRWATRCSFSSVSCSGNAAPGIAVRKRALPVVSSPLSEQRRACLIFAERIEIFHVKAWLATFKARNANLKLLNDRRKKKQLDRPAEGVHVRLHRSIVDLLSLGRCRSLSKSAVFGLFKIVASSQKLSTIHEVCLFSSRAESNFSQGRWRPLGNALSMVRQSSIG